MYRIDLYYNNIESSAYATNRESAVDIAKHYTREAGADIAKVYRYRRSGGMEWVASYTKNTKLTKWGE